MNERCCTWSVHMSFTTRALAGKLWQQHGLERAERQLPVRQQIATEHEIGDQGTRVSADGMPVGCEIAEEVRPAPGRDGGQVCERADQCGGERFGLRHRAIGGGEPAGGSDIVVFEKCDPFGIGGDQWQLPAQFEDRRAWICVPLDGRMAQQRVIFLSLRSVENAHAMPLVETAQQVCSRVRDGRYAVGRDEDDLKPEARSRRAEILERRHLLIDQARALPGAKFGRSRALVEDLLEARAIPQGMRVVFRSGGIRRPAEQRPKKLADTALVNVVVQCRLYP